MKKQTIILRTIGSDAQIPKPRLLDARGKRTTNNKISIYSHKYSTLMSTHSLPEDPPYPSTPMVKLQSDSASTQTMDRNIRPLISYQKAVSNYDTNGSRGYDQRMFALIRDQIHAAKCRYEAKMSEMLEASTKTICELRQMLMDNQRRIVQKQQIIYRLLMERQAAYSPKNILTNRGSSSTCSLPKLKQAEFTFFNNKVQDLQTKMRLFIEAFDASQKETAINLSNIQSQLVKYNGARLAKCRYGLAKNIDELNKKISILQQSLDRYPQKTQVNIPNKFIESFKFEITQLNDQLQHFRNKQWSYQSASLIKLQAILMNLNQKIHGSSLKGSRLNPNPYYFQDEDQFFYPNPDAIYQANDQYEHFQEDSQQQSDKKKQNKHPNYKMHLRKDIPI